MRCDQVEELLSPYLENELTDELRSAVEAHLQSCVSCCELKDDLLELIHHLPDLNQEVPFYLKNQLYYIPEQLEGQNEESGIQLKWLAAMIGFFVLMMNLFYFTQILPPAHRSLQLLVAKVQQASVSVEGLWEDLRESPNPILAFIFGKNKEKEKIVLLKETSADKPKIKNLFDQQKGGSNGNKSHAI